MQKAYRLFLAELRKHIENSRALLFADRTPSCAELRQTAVTFHTIKGGSGFFGLSEIARVSAALEQLLKATDLEPERTVHLARDLVTELEALTVALPPTVGAQV